MGEGRNTLSLARKCTEMPSYCGRNGGSARGDDTDQPRHVAQAGHEADEEKTRANIVQIIWL